MATSINTILSWFKTGLKPTQTQFWATWASFWHKDEQIPQNSISGLENALNTKAEKAQLDAHLNDKKAHVDLFDTKANSIHNHIIDDIEGLKNVLNDKALLSHTHEIIDIQGLKSKLDTKLTATLATDIETQIDTNISEDNKVISRSKLFSWWQWIKSKTQTISGSWNFTNGLKAEVSVDLKEPTSQKGISMVKDGLKFWFTEVINSLLKTNPSSTGISTVLMPEMQNGETKTLATLDDINCLSQNLDQTLSNGNTANNEIFLSNSLSSTILAVGTVGVGDLSGKFVTITPRGLSIMEDFSNDREFLIDSRSIIHKNEDSSAIHNLNWDESVSGTFNQTFQAKSGEIALLSDITGGSQNLDETLANGDTSDKNIVLSKDGAEMIIRPSNIDLRKLGVGSTLITPSSILHTNSNGGLLDLRFDETTIENYTQTFQAKSGHVALDTDITLQKAMGNGSFWFSDPLQLDPNRSYFAVNASTTLTDLGEISIVANEVLAGVREISKFNITEGGISFSRANSDLTDGTFVHFGTVSGRTFNYQLDGDKPSGTYFFATTDDIQKTVENPSTTALTSIDLNTAYPSSTAGFRVIAASTGHVYEKTSTGWIYYGAGLVP